MKKTNQLPRAVNNLQAIWEKKKVEMQFTQVEAAKELGWSQGAISHYLNNITDLGPAAVIKFANFLEVDPRDIDPTVVEHLPNVRTRIVKYDWTNLSKQTNEKIYDNNPPSTFLVTTTVDTFINLPDAVKKMTAQFPGQYLIRVCSVKDAPNANIFLVQLKGEKKALAYLKDDLPPAGKIAKMFAVLGAALLDMSAGLQQSYKTV